MSGRVTPGRTLSPPGGDHVRHITDRSRVQLESGATDRHSVPRRPSMEVQSSLADQNRGRMFETAQQHNQNYYAPTSRGGANDMSVSHDRGRVNRNRRGGPGGEHFHQLPRSARSRYSRQERDDFSDDRYVVPALPMPVAIICCVLNFLIPGFGSMTAAVCLLCCGKTDDMTGTERCNSCCTVFGIGLLQLVLVVCFLIGWIWSCIWGVSFIGMSATFYDVDEDDEESVIGEQHRQINNANGGTHTAQRGRSRLPTPQVVEDQPYPGLRYEDIQRQRSERGERGERSRRRQDNRSRRTRSRISITRSTLIYPMRAPSNIAYNSPPPSYQESENDRIRNGQAMSRSIIQNVAERSEPRPT